MTPTCPRLSPPRRPRRKPLPAPTGRPVGARFPTGATPACSRAPSPRARRPSRARAWPLARPPRTRRAATRARRVQAAPPWASAPIGPARCSSRRCSLFTWLDALLAGLVSFLFGVHEHPGHVPARKQHPYSLHVEVELALVLLPSHA